jgi:hypothetical protein
MRKALLFTLVLPAVSLLMFSQAARQQVVDKQLLRDLYGDKLDQPWKFSQEEAKAATGVVVSEEGEKLYLDIDPCNRRVMTFSKPYESEDTGRTVRCKGHELPLFFVRPKK